METKISGIQNEIKSGLQHTHVKKSDPAKVFFKKTRLKADVFFQKELLLVAFIGFLITVVCMIFY